MVGGRSCLFLHCLGSLWVIFTVSMWTAVDRTQQKAIAISEPLVNQGTDEVLKDYQEVTAFGISLYVS